MNDSARDRHLESILHAYLQAVDAGQNPDREELLRQHADVADELRAYFADQERMDRFAQSLHKVQDGEATIGPVEAADADNLPPRVRYFGDYELLSEIARGGMGVVYKARQVSLHRDVALKMILAGQLAGAADVQRFLTEAEAAANLDHPNIVPIYEVGQHEGQHYFSMKLIDGGSLAGCAAKFPSAPRAAGRLMAVVARAVHYAHQHGILHRDLKPANILLQFPAGQTAASNLAAAMPMVTDFGLAKRVEGDSRLTQSGAIVGTPSYMAPEQARADKQLTTAVDVYSLGAILYELFTGQPPFRGATPLDTVLQVLQEEPAAPRSIRPLVDRDLAIVALKCLDKEPARRYASADALAEDLERWLRGEPISARPAGNAERAWRWCRRNPTVAALTATTALALSAGIVISSLLAIESSNLAVAAKKQADRADGETKRATEAGELEAARAKTEAKAKEAAQQLLYISRINLAHNEWQTTNVTRALTLLEECAPARRGWEWHYLRRLGHGEIRRLTGHRATISALAVSPDGSRLAAASRDGSVYVWDTATGKQLQRFRGHRDVPTCVSFAPDGKRIASGSASMFGFSNQKSTGELLVWEPDTGAVIHTLGREHDGVKGCAFRPDGLQLASVGNDGKLRFWDLPKGLLSSTIDGPGAQGVQYFPGGLELLVWGGDGTRRVAPADPKAGWHIKGETIARLSPDGKALVTAGGGDAVMVRDPADGKELASLRGLPDGIRVLAFSPDGQLLAAGGSQGQTKLWDFGQRVELAVFRDRQPWIDGLAFSGDGKSLAIAVGNPLFEVLGGLFTGKEAPPPEPIRLCDIAGQESALLRLEKRATPVVLRFVPATGKIWLATENALVLHDPARVETARHIAAGDGSVTSLAVSDDGKLLAVAQTFKAEKGAAEGYLVKLLDSATGKDLRQLGWASAAVSALAFSPDGATLAVTGHDERTTLWDVATFAKRHTLTGNSGGVARLEFSSDGRTLYRLTTGMVTVGNVAPVHYRPGVLEVWDVASAKLLRSIVHMKELCQGLALRPDGTELAVADGDRVLFIDPATGAVLRTLAITAARGIAYHPDGRRVAILDRHGVRLWDAETAQELVTLRGFFDHVAFAREGHWLATANSSGVQIWDARPTPSEPESPVARRQRQTEPPPDRRPESVIAAVRQAVGQLDKGNSAAALPWLVEALRRDTDADRQTLHRWRLALALQETPQLRPVTAGGDMTHFVFDKIASLPITPDFSDPIDTWRLEPLWSPDGARLALTTRRPKEKSIDHIVELRDGVAGKVLADMVQPLARWSGRMYAFSADSRRFASFEPDALDNKKPVIRVRDALTGQPLGPPIQPGVAVKDWDEAWLSFSPDGRWVLVRETWGDKTTRVFDAATGQRLILPDPYEQAFFSADGALVLTAERGRRVNQAASVWETATRRLAGRFYVGEVHEACFSPDGKRVVLSHDNYYLSAWDVASGERLHDPILVQHGARALAFSSDGRRFAAAFEHDQQRVQVWDTETGATLTPPMPLPGTSACKLIQFLAGGQVLLTATDDEARLWDAQTGEPLAAPLKAPRDRFSSGQPFVQLSPDASKLYVRLDDATTARSVRSLAPATGAVEDLELLAQALSGQRIGSDGAAAPIAAPELATMRQKVQAKWPDRFGTPIDSDDQVRVRHDDGRTARLLAIAKDVAETGKRRSQAVAQLGEPGHGAALPALVDLARSDADVKLRTAALGALGGSGVPHPDALATLAAVLRQEKSAQLRRAAADALQNKTLAAASVTPLVEALRADADPYVRSRAAQALRDLPAPNDAVRQALRQALADQAGSVRVQAAVALFRLEPEAVEPVEVLLAAVQGKDETAQSSAIRHIGRLGPKARPAVPALAAIVAKEKITSHYRDRGWYALRALTQLGPAASEAIPILIAKLGDDYSDPSVTWTKTGYVGPDRCPITFALAHIGAEAIPELKRVVLADQAARPRLQAALALGFMGPRAAAALPDLEKLQQDLADPRRRPRSDDADLRTAVQLAIANIRRPDAHALVVPGLED